MTPDPHPMASDPRPLTPIPDPRPPTPDQVLQCYAAFLEDLDRILGESFQRAGDSIRCGPGCSDCCRGLFYIAPIEGEFLHRAFESLPRDRRDKVLDQCREIAKRIKEQDPRLIRPFSFSEIPVDEVFAAIDDLDSTRTRCPLLDESGRCLLYSAQPTACRYEGIPQIDENGFVVVADVCERNFRGENTAERHDLAFPYYTLDDMLKDLEERYNRIVFGGPEERKTFIALSLLGRGGRKKRL